jgi:ligand-binding sensor protein
MIKMELTEILPLKKWEKIERELMEKYNLQGVVFNAEGIRVTDTRNFSNSLCPAIKSSEKGQAFICAAAHMNMTTQARKTRKNVIEVCDAGLLKLVVPIYHNEEYLGVVSGCGMQPEDAEVDAFAINKIIGMDEEKVAHLSEDIAVISIQTAQDACRFIENWLSDTFKTYRKAG